MKHLSKLFFLAFFILMAVALLSLDERHPAFKTDLTDAQIASDVNNNLYHFALPSDVEGKVYLGLSVGWLQLSNPNSLPKISVTEIADQDNYNPVGFAAASVIEIDVSAGDIEMTGMAAQPDGTIKYVVALGGKIKFKKNDGGSVLANQFRFTDDHEIKEHIGTIFMYSTLANGWVKFESKP